MLVANEHKTFDLKKMKRLFGEPALLGDARMEDFDEYAAEIAESLDPGDAAAHALTWQFILESYWYMQLLRFQGHSARQLAEESSIDIGSGARISAAEVRAKAGIENGFEIISKYDYLIGQASKRITSLLLQIEMHRLALAESLKRKLDFEFIEVEKEYRQLQLRREDTLQAEIGRIEQRNREAARAQSMKSTVPDREAK